MYKKILCLLLRGPLLRVLKIVKFMWMSSNADKGKTCVCDAPKSY